MRILSVNVSHDASACILNDGKIECYFKEERITKRKRDKLSLCSIIESVKNFDGKIDYVLSNTHSAVRPGETELYYEILHRLSKVPYENIIEFYYCGICLCPLNKKIFSLKNPEQNPCPANKWKE